MKNEHMRPLFPRKFVFITIMLLLFFILGYVFLYRVSYNAMSGLAKTISSIINGKGELSEQIKKPYDQKEMKTSSNHLFVYYEDLNGLRTGDEIRYRGQVVGRIEIFCFNSEKDERYEVLLKFRDRNFKVKKNSKFYSRTKFSTNEKYMEIVSPKDEVEYLEKGSHIKGEEGSEVFISDLPLNRQ